MGLSICCAAADRDATIFAYEVADPERYGVVSFDALVKALSIIQKPTSPNSVGPSLASISTMSASLTSHHALRHRHVANLRPRR
ncbi:sugar phosphate nucleotidyltransferase [Hyphomicrobium sp. MC8b]|uniref:sugar phosphate nucleotidyltransferase n=1 Tax=Hyphomicrobium sp. MC8b TaxID=300273 RepID=UPI00391CCBF6